MSSHVLILGAGFGGLQLARRLSDANADVHVTLIDQSDSFTFGFAKLDILFGHGTAASVGMPYRDIAMPGVEFRREVITRVDPRSREVTTTDGKYSADFLVIALGADYAQSATPGFVEDGQEFYSIAGAERLGALVASGIDGRIVIAVLGVPYKCPPAPYEAALLLHEYLTRREVSGCRIDVITPMPAPIPPAPEASDAILAALNDRGIGYTPATRVRALDPGRHVALTKTDEIPYDLFIGIPVHTVPEVVAASGLTEGGTDGWVAVDRTNLRTRHPGVYAIGDCADAPVPRAGVFAENEATVVADDILATLTGTSPPAPFPGQGTCYIEMGDGRAGKVMVDFLSGPVPRAPFAGPTAEIAQEKSRYAAERQARWFGNITDPRQSR